MSINDDIISLREKMAQAIQNKIFDADSGGLFQTSLIEIMKKSEIKRQQCMKQAEHFERQKVNAEGQAAAYGTISSVVNQIVQSMISLEERRILEEQELDKERELDLEEETDEDEALREEDLKEEAVETKQTKKRATKKKESD